MAELGSTGDPKALIPGEPARVQQTVEGFIRYGDALVMAGEGLKSIDAGGWTGAAGDAFHEYFDGEPDRWIGCGQAFLDAAGALAGHAEALTWAQGQAAEAIALWERGEAATEQAKADHAAAQHQANQQAAAAATAGTPTAAPSLPFSDPGAELRTQAQHVLNTARIQLETIGDEAEVVVGQARDKAPPEPSLLGKATEFVTEFGAGAVEATVGLAQFAWQVSPTRMLVDPIGYHEDMTTLSQGIVNGVRHPAEFGKALIDYDTWKQSPGRALGHLVPDAIAAAATAGAGAAATRGARGLKTVDDVADGVQTADRASDTVTDLRRVTESATPSPGQLVPAVKPEVSDPKLHNIVDNLYKGASNPQRVGDGTTADAVRHERQTGEATHGRSHVQKAQDSLRGLENWLHRNPEAPASDRLTAQREAANLRNALGEE